MTEKKVRLDDFGVGLALFGIGGASLILGWQIYMWLRTSVWIPVSVLKALMWLNIPYWVQSPGDSLELGKLLDSIPLAFVLLVPGGIVGPVMIGVANE